MYYCTFSLFFFSIFWRTPHSEAAGWSFKKRKCGLCITYFLIVSLFYILKDTPLCEAAKNGHTDIVRLLIENGADVKKGWVR